MSINIVVVNLPADGGSPITDIEYDVNESNTWISLGQTTPGTYPSTAVVDDLVRLRAINAQGAGAPSLTKTIPALVTSVTMGSVTYTFSEPVEAGLDQTGRAYVVDPGDGVTVTAISPAQTTDDGLIVNGAQKNYAMGESQGMDARIAGVWSAGQNDTVPISLTAGDKVMKVVSDLTAVVGDRRGVITEFAVLHCVTTAPTATQVLGPTITWAGDTTPEVYNFDLDAFYAARTPRSASGITWFDYAERKARVGRIWPVYANNHETNIMIGYEAFSPRDFGASGSTSNYAVNVAADLGDFLLATTVEAGAQFTEAQIKEAIAITLMHGIEWGIPFANVAPLTTIKPNGGHHQFHQAASLFALNALGLTSEIPTFLNNNGGNWKQAFVLSDMADYAPHTDQFKAWFARERTLSTQPGGSTLSLPFNIPGYGGGLGFDMQRDSGMPVGTQFVRKSDGVRAITSAAFSVPNTAGNPVFADISLTTTSPFASGDVVSMLAPVTSPLQVGSYDWNLRGLEWPNDFSPGESGYQSLQRWGAHVLTLLAHGMTNSIEAVRGYFEWSSRLTNKPSATNNYPTMNTTLAAQYLTQNWVPEWSILVAPSAFVVGNWTLGAGGEVSVNALPNNGGALITSIEYRLDGGTWTAASGIAEFSVVNGQTIDFTIPSYTGQNVEIRAVNLVGAGSPSDVKGDGEPSEADINSITYDAGGAVIDYEGALAITYDAAGAEPEAT
jgi:hypothetical protein